jgi:N-acetylmuramoyl-L-alanine amidase
MRCRHRPQALRRSLIPALLLLCLAAALGAQSPQGTAALVLDGREVDQVTFLELAGLTPLFDPQPIARALGNELSTSPLQDSQTIQLDQKKMVFGPNNTTIVTVPAGGGREVVGQLSTPPLKDAGGIKVPMELLERVFGEEHNIEFRWQASPPRLELVRRTGREIAASIQLVHQYRVSTLEIDFSTKPRFRVERGPQSLEIRLIGDTFRLREPFRSNDDPLVKDVLALPNGLRIELAEGAAAAEPRLLEDGGAGMVIDVYQKVEARREVTRQDFAVGDLPGLRTVVLDPGHGGGETGAIANGIQESELTLRVARLLKQRIEQLLPVRVVLTRNDDVEVPHAQRVALANQNKGDLFISLHFNSYQGSRARGAETYFLSRAASDQLAAKLADAENANSGGGGGASSGLELILWDLAQSHHLAESQRFASMVQDELNTALGLPNRGVRQAPFLVLVGTMMPAVLVELGFISNPEEASRLQDPLYLDDLVNALSRAIVRFKTQVDLGPAAAAAIPVGGEPAVAPVPVPPVPVPPAPAGGGQR